MASRVHKKRAHRRHRLADPGDLAARGLVPLPSVTTFNRRDLRALGVTSYMGRSPHVPLFADRFSERKNMNTRFDEGVPPA